MNGFGAPAAGGFGKAPAAGGFGAPAAPAAGGFGKAPAAGGFGAPAAGAPAAGGFGAAAPAGGFGKAPAAGGFGAPAAGAPAAGGFGAPAAPAAGGFGKAPAAGGFGAPAAGAPAAGGFGAPAAPAAGGFGAAAPAGGFGKAPAAGGFGAPAAGGFGAPAAGGFGAAPPAGGFGKAPAAGGFGAPAAGGFGAAPPAAALPPTLIYTGIKGPGFTDPNTQSWLASVEISQVTDDTVVSNLPEPLKQHLGQLVAFVEQERGTHRAIKSLYESLKNDSNAQGIRSLEKRIESVTATASRTIDQLVVDVYHRDKAVKSLLTRGKDMESTINQYTKQHWDRLHKDGAEFWQQQWNLREPPSHLFHRTLQEVSQLMMEVDRVVKDLQLVLQPQRARGAAQSGQPGVPQGHSISARFETAPVIPNDPVQLVQFSMQQEMNAFLSLGSTVSALNSRASQVRAHIARYHGEAEAERLFVNEEKAIINESEEALLTLTIGETMKGTSKMFASKRHGRGNMFSFLPGNSKQRLVMHFDPRLEQQGNVTAAAPTAGGFGKAPAAAGGFGAPAAGGFAAPAAGGFGKAPAAAGGFGAPAAGAAPAAGGFGAPAAGAAPAAGGFGAPAAGAAPAAGGFGAPAAGAAPAAGGFGAPAAGAAPAAGGFGAPAAAPSVGFAGGSTPGGPTQPLSSNNGLGATPAPAGFGGATPGTGATPSIITPSLPGMSPSPTALATVGFEASPSPTPAASPDDRPKGKPRRDR